MAVEDSGKEMAGAELVLGKPIETRRRFLAKLGIGAVALALVGGSLGVLGRGRGGRQATANSEFPGEDSIFHPAHDSRRT